MHHRGGPQEAAPPLCGAKCRLTGQYYSNHGHCASHQQCELRYSHHFTILLQSKSDTHTQPASFLSPEIKCQFNNHNVYCELLSYMSAQIRLYSFEEYAYCYNESLNSFLTICMTSSTNFSSYQQHDIHLNLMSKIRKCFPFNKSVHSLICFKSVSRCKSLNVRTIFSKYAENNYHLNIISHFKS